MQLLKCDTAFQALIRGFPDDAHAAAADPSHQAISAADESLWFCHLLLLPRGHGFFHLGVSWQSNRTAMPAPPVTLYVGQAPILAGKGSSMSNAIINSREIRPSLPITFGSFGSAGDLSFWVRWRALW